MIFHFRSSSIGGHLHLTPLYPLVKSCKLEFKIWVKSDQWLLGYSAFHILRSSSILGRLPLEVIFIWHLCIIWISPINLSFKFEKDLTSGCWDIQLLIFWGRLHFKQFSIWFGFISLSLKYAADPISGSWDIPLLIEVVFRLRLSSVWGSLYFKHLFFGFSPLALSLKFEEVLISGCWDIKLLIFWGCLPL